MAVLIRGDREVNEIKLRRELKRPALELAGEETILNVTGAPLGFAGPVGLEGVKTVADHSLRTVADGITGANRADYHLVNVNLERDCRIEEFFDLSLAADGDPCPRCGGRMALKRGIEVGHVFKLGTKYSEAMGAVFRDEAGDERPCVMGCYGIGVSRTVAAAIEQGHDQAGIVWPLAVAPYQVLIVCLAGGDESLSALALDLHDRLDSAGVEVLLDDRDAGAGVKFNDADLIGVPLRVTVGKRFLKSARVELRLRATGETRECLPEELPGQVEELIKAGLKTEG